MQRDLTAKPRPHPAIETFLANPWQTFSLADLAHFWRTTRITFIFRRPPDLEGGMRLAAAVRGALGEPLKAIAERQPAHSLGSLFHAMYADHCMFEARWHVPKPFVIWVREENGKIYVQISLFGEAGCFREDLIEAMLLVMTPVKQGGQGGISLAYGRSTRRLWELLDIYWQEREGYLPPPVKNIFVLASLTSLIPSNQAVLRYDQPGMLHTIFARIAGLARWHGIKAGPDMSFGRLEDLCRQTEISSLLPSSPFSTSRRSRTFAKRERRQLGYQLNLRISKYPEELWPGFVIGTLTHAGYDVSQGYGRYEICDP